MIKKGSFIRVFDHMYFISEINNDYYVLYRVCVFYSEKWHYCNWPKSHCEFHYKPVVDRNYINCTNQEIHLAKLFINENNL